MMEEVAATSVEGSSAGASPGGASRIGVGEFMKSTALSGSRARAWALAEVMMSGSRVLWGCGESGADDGEDDGEDDDDDDEGPAQRWAGDMTPVACPSEPIAGQSARLASMQGTGRQDPGLAASMG